MRDESGSALVMVMGVLTIVSLIGVGLLVQSRSDTMFTRAMANSMHTFGLADGATSIAIEQVKTWGKQLTNEKWTGNVVLKNLGKEPIKTVTGDYVPSGYFKGYDKTRAAGWDMGAYMDEFWLVEGRGSSGNLTTVIDAAILKLNKTGYGDY